MDVLTRISDSKALIMILIMGAVTYLLRLLPFVLFPGTKKTPAYIEYLGKVLPYAIIGMLVVYCLKGVSFLSAPFGLPELISTVLIVLVHIWKRNTLLSIGGGTIIYMLLVQFVFH